MYKLCKKMSIDYYLYRVNCSYRLLSILIRNIYFIIKRLHIHIMYVLRIRYVRTLEFLEF